MSQILLPSSTVKQNKKTKTFFPFFCGENRCCFVDGNPIYDTISFGLIGKQLASEKVFWGDNQIFTYLSGANMTIIQITLGDHHSLKLSLIYFLACVFFSSVASKLEIVIVYILYSVLDTKHNACGSFQSIFFQ